MNWFKKWRLINTIESINVLCGVLSDELGCADEAYNIRQIIEKIKRKLKQGK